MQLFWLLIRKRHILTHWHQCLNALFMIKAVLQDFQTTQSINTDELAAKLVESKSTVDGRMFASINKMETFFETISKDAVYKRSSRSKKNSSNDSIRCILKQLNIEMRCEAQKKAHNCRHCIKYMIHCISCVSVCVCAPSLFDTSRERQNLLIPIKVMQTTFRQKSAVVLQQSCEKRQMRC